MILALLNPKAGSGKTTLALNLAGEWARRGERVILIDADPGRAALAWSRHRTRARLPRRFTIVSRARSSLREQALELAHGADRVIVDGPSGVIGATTAALLAADLVLIPTRPSPADADAVIEIARLVLAVRAHRPGLPVRFVFNRRSARADLAGELAALRADYEPALLDSVIGRHGAFGTASRSGRLAREPDAGVSAAREIAALADEIDGLGLAPGSATARQGVGSAR